MHQGAFLGTVSIFACQLVTGFLRNLVGVTAVLATLAACYGSAGDSCSLVAGR